MFKEGDRVTLSPVGLNQYRDQQGKSPYGVITNRSTWGSSQGPFDWLVEWGKEGMGFHYRNEDLRLYRPHKDLSKFKEDV